MNDLRASGEDTETSEAYGGLQAAPVPAAPARAAADVDGIDRHAGARRREDRAKPRRDAILGAILGFLLGVGIVMVRNTMNTRVSSAREVENLVGLPLLGRLAEPAKRLQKETGWRCSRSRTGSRPRTTACSARTSSSRTSTAARRASWSRARRCPRASPRRSPTSPSPSRDRAATSALVDLDLRRPMLEHFFGLEGAAGLTEVTLGRVGLSDALVEIPVRGRGRRQRPRLLRRLRVLTGRLPALPTRAELLRSAALSSVLAELSEDADIVLIDAPPLLHVERRHDPHRQGRRDHRRCAGQPRAAPDAARAAPARGDRARREARRCS